jgi:aldehyde dehydrogenase (NAD+)
VHGPDGLKEFTYAKAVARQRFRPALPLTSFARTEKHEANLATLIAVLHGRTNQLSVPRGPLRLLPPRKRHVMEP